MAIKTPTENQKRAIDTCGNVLVSAAAGSGKTAVLVERVIKKLTDSVNPISADRLLIVTFTNAAAAEMRTRIEKRFNEEIKAHPNDVGLLKQKYLLSGASICTIDSFCIDLVRQNFDKLGINPDFKMSDPASLKVIDEAVAKEIFKRRIEESDPAFLELLDIIGSEYDEKDFVELVLKIYSASRNFADPDLCFDTLVSEYKSGQFTNKSVWYNYAFYNAQQILGNDLKVLESVAEEAALSDIDPKISNDACEAEKEMLKSLVDCSALRDWDKMYLALNNAIPTELKSGKDESELYGVLVSLFDIFKKDVKRFKNLFNNPAEEIKKQYKKLARPMEVLADVLKEFDRELFNAYNDANTFTFHNTTHLALKLLSDSESDIANAYDEVMVDEYQDVNDLQERLFKVLSKNEKNLFVVGDAKQSIYGFRGANPYNFLEKKGRYISAETALEVEPKKIILSDNFRSRKGICEYVNFVFELFMHKNLSDIEYDNEEKLFPNAKFVENNKTATEIHLIDKANLKAEKTSVEANYVADYIKKVLSEEPFLKDKENENTLRKATYGDFAILLRKNSSSEKLTVFANTLKAKGIPVSLNTGEFLESVEVLTALSLLKVIDNPYNDIELLTVMLSQIFNFTSEKVAEIRAENKEIPIYSSLLAAEEKGDEQVKNMLDILRNLRLSAVNMPLSKFVSKALNSTNYVRTVTALGGGITRRNNLMRLINMAAEYENSYSGGIDEFIKYVKTATANPSEDSSSGKNAVRIMTMHRSKGLQFPICIVSDLDVDFGRISNNEKSFYKPKYGLGFKYFDEETKEKVTSLPYAGLVDAERYGNLAEEMRLFYVALTRAEERLVLTACFDKLEKPIKRAKALLRFNNDGNFENILPHTVSFADLIISSALINNCGHELRGNGSNIIPTDNSAEFKIVTHYAEENEETALEKEPEATPDDALAEKIGEVLKYKYPLEELSKVKSKVSVSQIANKAEFNRFAFESIPSVTATEGITATERGTATHNVMQFFDFNATAVKDEIERLVEWQFITERQAKAVNILQIENFLKSDVFARIKKAKKVYREMRFLTEIPASMADNTLPENIGKEEVMLQGAVDLCFEEDDGIVVLDFKTDRVESADALKEAYKDQLSLYASACQKMFNKPVKQCILYSFNLSKEILI